RGLSVSPTSFAKANCAVPAIDGPMLNRDSLTPIYPASLSDCLIQTDPLSDARLTRLPLPGRLCSGRVTSVPLPKAQPTPSDQRRRHVAHGLKCPCLHASPVEGSKAKRPVAKGGDGIRQRGEGYPLRPQRSCTARSGLRSVHDEWGRAAGIRNGERG